MDDERWPWEDDTEFTAKDHKMLKAILAIVQTLAAPSSNLKPLRDSLEASLNKLKAIGK